ncbi:(2Fe-2S)-binding protein [Xanthobacter autotrophicus]|uniref:(2Fe-2S)-binding protein n=1 Tax=Xanthobacter autotrophicus TaxID=280 RepID=UPI001E4C0394|nr:(2Fe-2S)-binding protein [Xanthobacter autotrophicus]UDQ91732.1 (2Fe-2S)-binding protein [Xanthobacter autotrophicus]
MTTFTVNGTRRTIAAAPDTPLLYVLRGELELNGAKFGCGLGQCGACTVLVDGEPVFSCVTPVMLLDGRAVHTIEGLGSADAPGPVQAAFIAEQAAQCGYCIAGMVMRAQALLERDGDPDDDAILAALEPSLCRCGTHVRIVRAVKRAARTMAGKTTAGKVGAVR